METLTMRTTLLFIFSILLTSHVYAAWEIKADFETGAVGDTAQLPNTDAFHDTAKDSKYADSPALSGSQSGSVTVKQGENGFSNWGGSFKFPTNLKEGDNIWFRVNVYYPKGWDFSCSCSQGMKFMRIHTASSSGLNEGYHSTLIKGGTTGGLITVDTEVEGSEFKLNNAGPDFNNDQRQNLGTPAPRDRWITYEMQIKLHSTSGKGIYRVWQDGNLIFEDLKTATLRSPTSISDFVYLYTYWNNGAPVTQTSYVDDIVVTSTVPGKKDASGNSYIGVGASIYISIPNPPTLVTAISK